MIQFKIGNQADQQFSTILNRRRVTIRLRFNVSTDRWNMDLSIDDRPVLHGRRIVTGIDLLAPFNFGIGKIFAVAERAGREPNRENLPRGLVGLYHATDAEVEAFIAAAEPPPLDGPRIVDNWHGTGVMPALAA